MLPVAYLGRPWFLLAGGSGGIRRPEIPETGSGSNRYMLRNPTEKKVTLSNYGITSSRGVLV